MSGIWGPRETLTMLLRESKLGTPLIGISAAGDDIKEGQSKLPASFVSNVSTF